jgi:hypothetical protein
VGYNPAKADIISSRVVTQSLDIISYILTKGTGIIAKHGCAGAKFVQLYGVEWKRVERVEGTEIVQTLLILPEEPCSCVSTVPGVCSHSQSKDE